MRALSIVFAAAIAATCGQAPPIEGTWQGTLTAGQAKLRLGLHIAKTSTGDYTSTLDSVDQGRMGLPVTHTLVSGNSLHLELPDLHAQFDGTHSLDGNEIDGTFTQGARFPLTFKRGDRVQPLNRPQTPKQPFPYDSIDVSYRGAVTLAGTLSVPLAGGPFPVVTMITGSGPQDRDETLFGHKPFLVIADYLARRGIAVLRVDDRGVGGSSGDSARATIDDMSDDVLAGVNF
jgi:hypothetical protein